MVHGTTHNTSTWCGEPLGEPLGPTWSALTSEIDCVPCLRAALAQSCAKCKDRKRAAKEAR